MKPWMPFALLMLVYAAMGITGWILYSQGR